MVENVLNPQELERQRNQENVVGRIAALNDMKSASQIDPPRVQKLPKQRAAVFDTDTREGYFLLWAWGAGRYEPPRLLRAVARSPCLVEHSTVTS